MKRFQTLGVYTNTQHTNAHTRTHTIHTHPHVRSHTKAHSHIHKHTNARTHAHTHTHSLSLSLSLTHTHSLFLSLSVSLSLSLTHTTTNTPPSHTLPHTYIHNSFDGLKFNCAAKKLLEQAEETSTSLQSTPPRCTRAPKQIFSKSVSLHQVLHMPRDIFRGVDAGEEEDVQRGGGAIEGADDIEDAGYATDEVGTKRKSWLLDLPLHTLVKEKYVDIQSSMCPRFLPCTFVNLRRL